MLGIKGAVVLDKCPDDLKDNCPNRLASFREIVVTRGD
jgi:hypothetical protein